MSAGTAHRGGAAAIAPACDGSRSDTWAFGEHATTVVIDGRDTDARTYTLSTTARLRDDLPADKRVVFVEEPGQLLLRSGHDLFDALFAMAVHETRLNSVSSIADNAFDGGAPVPCECFETGEKWTYVWTRDTAYAAHLALALVDPVRAMNSLRFKLSAKKPAAGGGAVQLVQDTGSGGSYPVSTDRVVWALGAREVLAYLDGAARDAFRATVYAALENTIAQDRAMVYDARDGLYRGEQSFLDWREQSYPLYTRDDTTHIAMAKALSTNVGHLELLRLAAELARELGQGARETEYRGYADALERAIHRNFWLEDAGQYSTLKHTELDPVALARYDLLGASLAVLAGIPQAGEAARAVANYPRTVVGSPVIWPQQPSIPIYHNRAIWPFVTAYSSLAARRVENARVVDHDMASLVRGAALNLSNMENLEFSTGASWYDDGPFSGPVVNSRRQLWSVAGYLAMVTKQIFGLETTQDGIRFRPFVTRATRQRYFGRVDRVSLRNVMYRGKRIDVDIVLPDCPGADATGHYQLGAILLNGAPIGDRFVSAAELGASNQLTITLLDRPGAAGEIRVLEDTGDARRCYAPRTPELASPMLRDGLLELGLESDEAGVVFNVYRDGQMIAAGLGAGRFTDPDSGDHATRTHCYAVEAEFPGTGNRSHHSAPRCYWGSANQRIQEFDAAALSAVGGTFSTRYGRPHYQDWGDPGHTLTLPSFTAAHTGAHYVQLVYSNGAGPVNTGITAALKWVEVEDIASGAAVGAGPITMPQRGDWSIWADSTLLPVQLAAGHDYRVRISDGVNMSYFDHFRRYGGTGGDSRPYNRVAIASVKILAL